MMPRGRPARDACWSFWRCEGFVHGKALEYGTRRSNSPPRRLQRTCRTITRSSRPKNLAKYDAVILNNTTALDTRANPFIEPALIDYVRSGKAWP